MSKSITMSLVAVSLAGAVFTAQADGSRYIPWTFDDFNSNCEVVEGNEAQAVRAAVIVTESIVPPVAVDSEVGELGW